MANNVTVVLLGGQPQVVSGVNTVKEATEKLSIESGLSVTMNGKSADYSSSLSDYAFISFGSKVKGGKQ